MSQNPHDRTVVQPYLGFDCTKLSPTEAYRLLNHLVAPRPIAFGSTISADGIPNLDPFSFFMVGGLDPPSVAFSPTIDRREQLKDTLQNIQATGDGSLCFVSQHTAKFNRSRLL